MAVKIPQSIWDREIVVVESEKRSLNRFEREI